MEALLIIPLVLVLAGFVAWWFSTGAERHHQQSYAEATEAHENALMGDLSDDE